MKLFRNAHYCFGDNAWGDGGGGCQSFRGVGDDDILWIISFFFFFAIHLLKVFNSEASHLQIKSICKFKAIVMPLLQ